MVSSSLCSSSHLLYIFVSLRDKNHLYNVYTMLYTMPGVPSIYYGSEYGIEGRRTWESDYDLRPCLDLNNVPNANLMLNGHISRLGRVRLGLEALKYGDFENVNIMNEKLVYKRFTGNQTVFVAFNLTDRDERIGFDARCNGPRPLHIKETLDVTRCEPPCPSLPTCCKVDELDGATVTELLTCDLFRVKKAVVTSKYTAETDETSFAHLMVLAGEGKIECGDTVIELTRGDGVFVPAGAGSFTVTGSLTLLESRL